MKKRRPGGVQLKGKANPVGPRGPRKTKARVGEEVKRNLLTIELE